MPDLELDFGPLTALVGPRGSGKSQLLSAIAGPVGRAEAIPPALASIVAVTSGLRT